MSKRTKNVAVGALIAAAAGYVAGILTAPKKGSETRQDLINAGLKTKAEAERQFKRVNTELTRLIAQAEQLAKKTKATAKVELPKNLERAKNVKAKVREIITGLHEGDSMNDDLKKALEDGQRSIDHLKKFLANSPSESKKSK